jgi:hypothetical protein
MCRELIFKRLDEIPKSLIIMRIVEAEKERHDDVGIIEPVNADGKLNKIKPGDELQLLSDVRQKLSGESLETHKEALRGSVIYHREGRRRGMRSDVEVNFEISDLKPGGDLLCGVKQKLNNESSKSRTAISTSAAVVDNPSENTLPGVSILDDDAKSWVSYLSFLDSSRPGSALASFLNEHNDHEHEHG